MACSAPPLESGVFASMGSPVEVQVHGDGAEATRLVEEAFREVEEEPEHPDLLVEAERLRIATGGAFDVGWSGGVDVGGIAKGWALDKAGERLRQEGFDNFCLSAGGQVLVQGGRDGAPWRVGIRQPGAPLHQPAAVLQLTEGSASTSGQYERPGHIVDPSTTEPAPGGSATVVHAQATDADALSTALFVLGPKEGQVLADALGVEVYFFE